MDDDAPGGGRLVLLPARGSRVVVTGARGGFGTALADALVGCGCTVTGIDRPGSGADVEADLTDEAATDAAVATAATRMGGIDALVGAAGLVDTVQRATALPAEAFQRDLADNLTSQFLAARAAHRHLAAAATPAIVMVSSVACLEGLVGQTADAAAKAGVVGLVRSLAAEWVGDGIRVNAVAPGLFATPEVRGLPDRARDHLRAAVPMGRVAELDEVVGPVLLLLSPAAGYITGQVLRIDGGTGLGVHGRSR